MKKRTLGIGIVSCAAALMSLGCFKSPTSTADKLSDGSAGDIAMEMTQMSSETGAGSAKMTADAATAAADADTVEYVKRIIIKSWTYDPATYWWTRSFQDSTSNGRALVRTDSLQFTDNASQLLQTMPRWVSTSGWTHIRHVSRHGLINTFNSRFAMTVVVTKAADTEATWNGTITGVWNGVALSSTTVTNVVRKFADVNGFTWWRFPSSGGIFINNPLRTWNVTFTGNGSATATVTRKSDNKQKTITIIVSTGAEIEN